MDLRLHAPTPDVVIVRVSGPVQGVAARVLVNRVGKQLSRAPHVVLDLSDVSVLDPRGLTVLSMLHQQAMARETQLHIVGVEHEVVRRALHSTGLTQLLSRESTADAVIAALPGPGYLACAGTGRIGP
jgi:anti-anti-sigma factor